VPELVALDLPGGPAFVDALQAIWDTGDAAAPLDPRLPPAARRSLLDALRPSRVVGSDGIHHHLPDGVGVEVGDALVVATSGSSGTPKGVVLTHAAIAASADATSRRLRVDPARHTWLACLPLAHVGGLSVVTRALVTGTPLIVLPGFDAAVVQALGQAGRATHVSLVATALRRVEAASFTRILLGGSRPPGHVPPNVVATYGMTETGSGVVYDGRPLDGVDVAIDADGQILLRGPMLLRAYRDGSNGRGRGPDGTDGWLATGDAGALDDDGLLRVMGRMAEVIVTGGEKVWPDAVERVLSTHAAVAEVAVWKRDDPEWGERVVAWVVPQQASASVGGPARRLGDELRALVASTLGPWAAPKEVRFATALPRTPSGKVRRSELP
jgi:O-succinylbenzoic acid--CoA ligase